MNTGTDLMLDLHSKNEIVPSRDAYISQKRYNI